MNGRTDLEVGASPDQRSVRDEERRKAGEGGDAKEMTRQTKRVAKVSSSSFIPRAGSGVMRGCSRLPRHYRLLTA